MGLDYTFFENIRRSVCSLYKENSKIFFSVLSSQNVIGFHRKPRLLHVIYFNKFYVAAVMCLFGTWLISIKTV